MDKEIEKYLGQTLGDRYSITELIGEGGMAYVFKATDNRLQRTVAVKIMRDEMAADETFRSRFCAESHAVAMLSHPNIVSVYDVSHNDELEYIVMELVEGITLLQYMEKKGALPWNEALHFSRQIAKALDHAHTRGIIHRDIKPQNIMLLKDGTIKVADFGIAALENELYENDGQAIGSIHYIAPEQARGDYPDTRSDLYSLGVVMYEMFTGEKPYIGDSLGEIAVKHMNADPKPIHEIIPDFPPELERITSKAMSADIENRYQTAADLVRDIDDFLKQTSNSSAAAADTQEPASGQDKVRQKHEDSLREKLQKHERRQRNGMVGFLVGVFCVISAVIGVFVFLWQYWLSDIFLPAQRVTMPNFISSNIQELEANADYSAIYNFNIIYVVNTDTEPGTVLTQSPNAGRSIMLTQNGIDVKLTVSTGDTISTIPDVSNMDYRTASGVLRQYGLYIEIINVVSDVEKDRVIRTEPEAGIDVKTASLVYLYVSSGSQVSSLTVPNLIGLSEEAAISQIESYGFNYGWSQHVISDLTAGTVIGQSEEAFSLVEEHTNIYLTVSDGPEIDG
jgi:serine/threonine-protein kinase